MITLLAEAKSTGRVVNWSKLKKGKLVDQSRFSLFGFGTIIPDVIVDVMNYCHSIDQDYVVNILFPNGFTTAQFDIAIQGKGFQVNCGRRLERGLFPLNPIAAEFGSNYDVLVTASADDLEFESSIKNIISRKYECKKIVNSEQTSSAPHASGRAQTFSMKSLLNILKKTELPEVLKPDSAVVDWLTQLGIDQDTIRILSECSFTCGVQVNRIYIHQFNALKTENLDEQSSQCLENVFLIIGIGLNGDPIIMSLENLCVGYASHDELWEEEEYQIEEIIEMTKLDICEFFLNAFDDNFPTAAFELYDQLNEN